MGKKQHAKDKLYILHTEWKCGRCLTLTRCIRTIEPKLSNHSHSSFVCNTKILNHSLASFIPFVSVA